MSDNPTLDDFTIGETYEVEVGGTIQPLRLKDARALPQSVRPGGSFLLDFRGPREPIFAQGTYRVRSGERSWDMFLVPHGPEQDGASYMATYN